jgi:hypothetical protein
MILRIPKLRAATALAARSKSRLAYLAAVQVWPGFLSQGLVPNVDKICAIGHGVTGASPGACFRLPGGALAAVLVPLVDKGAVMWTDFA